jgi:hypothetical protein
MTRPAATVPSEAAPDRFGPFDLRGNTLADITDMQWENFLRTGAQWTPDMIL